MNDPSITDFGNVTLSLLAVFSNSRYGIGFADAADGNGIKLYLL
jgi:hypothetical protein